MLDFENPFGTTIRPDLAFGVRCPQPPREARRLHVPVATSPVSDRPLLGRKATSMVEDLVWPTLSPAQGAKGASARALRRARTSAPSDLESCDPVARSQTKCRSGYSPYEARPAQPRSEPEPSPHQCIPRTGVTDRRCSFYPPARRFDAPLTSFDVTEPGGTCTPPRDSAPRRSATNGGHPREQHDDDPTPYDVST